MTAVCSDDGLTPAPRVLRGVETACHDMPWRELFVMETGLPPVASPHPQPLSRALPWCAAMLAGAILVVCPTAQVFCNPLELTPGVRDLGVDRSRTRSLREVETPRGGGSGLFSLIPAVARCVARRLLTSLARAGSRRRWDDRKHAAWLDQLSMVLRHCTKPVMSHDAVKAQHSATLARHDSESSPSQKD